MPGIYELINQKCQNQKLKYWCEEKTFLLSNPVIEQ